MSSFAPSSFFGSNRSSPTGSSTSSNRSNASSRESGVDRPRHSNQTPSPSNNGRQPENIVVSSRELKDIFKSLKDVTDLVKEQKKGIADLGGTIDGLKRDLQELKDEVAEMKTNQLESDQGLGNVSSSHYGAVPKEVKDDLRILYKNQDDAHKFKGSEGIDSQHNCGVRHFLANTMANEHRGYSKADIMRAVTRCFETQRQLYLDSLPERKEAVEKKQNEKRLTSRRRRLFNQRLKVAVGDEKNSMLEINHNWMSDEEDGVGNDKGCWIVRSPTFRSRRLNDLLSVLQERLDRKEDTSKHPKNKRLRGVVSEFLPPSLAPEWALSVNARNRSPLRRNTEGNVNQHNGPESDDSLVSEDEDTDARTTDHRAPLPPTARDHLNRTPSPRRPPPSSPTVRDHPRRTPSPSRPPPSSPSSAHDHPRRTPSSRRPPYSSPSARDHPRRTPSPRRPPPSSPTARPKNKNKKRRSRK